jgi:F0F1-type ATP synthase membrane subunit c/vacuolar-type H+-ATPase subunit K
MTELNFKRKLFTRIILSAVLCATGIILSLYFAFWGEISETNDYIYGLLVGLTGVGFGNAIMYMHILRSPSSYKKRLIAENDERNKQISQKAWACAGYMSIFAILVSTLFVPSEFIKYILCLMCVPLIVYFIAFGILRRTT